MRGGRGGGEGQNGDRGGATNARRKGPPSRGRHPRAATRRASGGARGRGSRLRVDRLRARPRARLPTPGPRGVGRDGLRGDASVPRGRGGRRGGAPSSTPTRNRAAQTLILAPRAHGASRGRVGSAFAARARRGRTWNWSILFIGGTDCLGYRGARDFLSVLGLHDEVAAGEGRGRDVRLARSRARRAQRDDGVAGAARERRGARSARTCGRWGRSAS